MEQSERDQRLVDAALATVYAVAKGNADALPPPDAVPDDLSLSEWWGMCCVQLELIRQLVPPKSADSYYGLTIKGTPPPNIVLVFQVVGKWLSGDTRDACGLVMACDEQGMSTFGADLAMFAGKILRQRLATDGD